MPAIQPLGYLLQIKPKQLSKQENILLEAELLNRICDEPDKSFSIYLAYYPYGAIIADPNYMLEANFIRQIITDILTTNEYTLAGIAYYMNTHEDVIYEVATGRNTDPSSTILRKSIELHKSVRPQLYQEIIKKIIDQYLNGK